jgi:hypothetical protein
LEVEKNVAFVLACAAAAPRLRWLEVSEETLGQTPQGEPIRLIRARFQNDGFLSTSGTEKASETGVVPPIRVTFSPPADGRLKAGQHQQTFGPLSGRVLQATYLNTVQSQQGVPNSDQKQCEWVVEGAGLVQINVWSPRAGVLRASSGTF